MQNARVGVRRCVTSAYATTPVSDLGFAMIDISLLLRTLCSCGGVSPCSSSSANLNDTCTQPGRTACVYASCSPEPAHLASSRTTTCIVGTYAPPSTNIDIIKLHNNALDHHTIAGLTYVSVTTRLFPCFHEEYGKLTACTPNAMLMFTRGLRLRTNILAPAPYTHLLSAP